MRLGRFTAAAAAAATIGVAFPSGAVPTPEVAAAEAVGGGISGAGVVEVRAPTETELLGPRSVPPARHRPGLSGLLLPKRAALAQRELPSEPPDAKPARPNTTIDPQAKPSGGRKAAPHPRPGTRAAARLASQHFRRALRAYREGDYAAALVELHRAAALDPRSKDLEYNLALVHEKAGQLGDAIEHWTRYRALETSTSERKRAELAIRRLQGAHARLLHMLHPYEQMGRGWQGSRTAAQAGSQRDRYLRNWAVGMSIASAAMLCLGVGLGVVALRTDPDRDSSIGQSTRATLEARAHRAHAYALGADIAIAAGVGAGVAAGVFWFVDGQGSGAQVGSPRGTTSMRSTGVRFGGAF